MGSSTGLFFKNLIQYSYLINLVFPCQTVGTLFPSLALVSIDCKLYDLCYVPLIWPVWPIAIDLLSFLSAFSNFGDNK